MARSLPFPPLPLMNRVGSVADAPDPELRYVQIGEAIRAAIDRVLPPAWEWSGKSVLDFGCGAGRTLRHFATEAHVAEFWGCDIDVGSIDWLRENLDPPFRAVQSGVLPPLPFDDGSFDLVYCVSVFTHLGDEWAPWLLELRRVLRDNGRLIATFMGEGMSESIVGEPWDETRIGMNTLRYGQPWDLGGPMVLHSPWWIRAHWGRLFDIEHIEPYGFATEAPTPCPAGQGVVVMTPLPSAVGCGVDDLVAAEPDEPRELISARHHSIQLARELVILRQELGAASTELDRAREELDGQAAAANELRRQHHTDSVGATGRRHLTSQLRRIRARLQKSSGS